MTASSIAPGRDQQTSDRADEALTALGYQPTLKRQLGFGALLVHGLLFFVPMAPVAVFGIVVNRSGGLPVLAYLVAAAVMGLSALSYREMALRYPVAGSVYGYVRLSMNHHVGAAAGWLMLLDYTLLPSLLTVLAAISLGHLVSGVPVALLAALFVAASLALNLMGIGITTRIGWVLLGIQLSVIALFAFFVARQVWTGTLTLSFDSVWRPDLSWPMVLGAASIAAFSYIGFDAVSTLNEEARGGGRAVGWATWVLLALATVLFTVQNLLAHLVMPATSFPEGVSTTRAFYLAVDQVAPGWYSTLFTLTNALVAIFACLVVSHASSARLVFAMARDNSLPRFLARTSRRGVPHVATLTVALLTMGVAVGFADHAETMTSLVTFGALTAYVILHLAVISSCFFGERSGKWWAHLVSPIIGAGFLVVILSRTSDLTRWLGLGWLTFGMLVHVLLLVRRRRSPIPLNPDAVQHPSAPSIPSTPSIPITPSIASTPAESITHDTKD